MVYKGEGCGAFRCRAENVGCLRDEEHTEAVKTRPVFAPHRTTDQDGGPHGTISLELGWRRPRVASRRR